jgi:hypothetical protein
MQHEIDPRNLSIDEDTFSKLFSLISGKDAEIITNSIMKNSKRQGAGKCGYNIKVIFKKDDGTEYHALLMPIGNEN